MAVSRNQIFNLNHVKAAPGCCHTHAHVSLCDICQTLPGLRPAAAKLPPHSFNDEFNGPPHSLNDELSGLQRQTIVTRFKKLSAARLLGSPQPRPAGGLPLRGSRAKASPNQVLVLTHAAREGL